VTSTPKEQTLLTKYSNKAVQKFVNFEKCEQNCKLLSKIGLKNRIVGKKNRWEKSKIDSSLACTVYIRTLTHSCGTRAHVYNQANHLLPVFQHENDLYFKQISVSAVMCVTFSCRKEMIDRLCRVIGINDANDPDPSYVLTTDNLLKMMAIHMRFR